jgi:hypothetical protein
MDYTSGKEQGSLVFCLVLLKSSWLLGYQVASFAFNRSPKGNNSAALAIPPFFPIPLSLGHTHPVCPETTGVLLMTPVSPPLGIHLLFSAHLFLWLPCNQ